MHKLIPLDLSRRQTVLLGFLGTALVGAADAAVGFEISLITLHMIPVLFVTWFAGLAWGIFFTVLMAAISSAATALLLPEIGHPFLRFLDLASDFVATLLLVFMLSRLRVSYQQAHHQSKSDALTGCLNRRGLGEQLQSEVDRTRRYGHAFSLAYFDCDNFKAVNDTLGHHVGDALLAEIGRVLHNGVRSVDAAARLGGDEFAVLLRESNADAALHAAQLIKRALDEAMRRHGWPVSFSIGVASFDSPPDNADKVLSLADALMYEVKRHGKDDIRVRSF